MANTDNIEAPLLDQNVAQPEVPHNEALVVIDAAICGQLDVTMTIDTDYTLDNVDTTYPQEWQYGVIEILTIAHTDATSNLIVPDGLVNKYIVKNNSGSGFGITFKTTTGSGWLIPDDDIFYAFYCDGVEIHKVQAL